MIKTLLLSFAMLARPASAQLSEGRPEWYLPTGDGCNLFVQEYGQGKQTIVVLHGGFGAEHSYMLDAFKDWTRTRSSCLLRRRRLFGALNSRASICATSNAGR